MTRKLFMHVCVYIMEDFGNHWLIFAYKKIKKILKLDEIQGSKTGRLWATALGRCFEQILSFFFCKKEASWIKSTKDLENLE